MVRQSAAALAALFLVLTGLSARAAGGDVEFYIGEDLYAQCSAPPAAADVAVRQARCAAYVMGVSDSLQARQGAGGDSIVCLPGGTTAPQTVDAVRRFLETHPEKRQIAAEDLVREALSAAYPCR